MDEIDPDFRTDNIVYEMYNFSIASFQTDVLYSVTPKPE